MKISSSSFEHDGTMPSKYTCDGEDLNPPLTFSGVPSKARSLVLIMDDPDVPKYLREDGVWDHWIIFNIPSGVTEIREGEEPRGVAGIGTSGNLEYHGPCPPDTEHRYFFRLYALDSNLDLRESSTKEEVLNSMEGKIIDQAELIGKYERRVE